MRKAELFVNPSTREGQSHVLLEAMAARTPPIGIYKPDSGVMETIKNGINGLLVTSNKLADAIVKILQDKKFSKMLAENGRRFAEDRDWDKIAEMVLNVYTSVAKKKGKI
jgi:glycosyltransferase involved in cell wall biosynthesis